MMMEYDDGDEDGYDDDWDDNGSEEKIKRRCSSQRGFPRLHRKKVESVAKA